MYQPIGRSVGCTLSAGKRLSRFFVILPPLRELLPGRVGLKQTLSPAAHHPQTSSTEPQGNSWCGQDIHPSHQELLTTLPPHGSQPHGSGLLGTRPSCLMLQRQSVGTHLSQPERIPAESAVGCTKPLCPTECSSTDDPLLLCLLMGHSHMGVGSQSAIPAQPHAAAPECGNASLPERIPAESAVGCTKPLSTRSERTGERIPMTITPMPQGHRFSRSNQLWACVAKRAHIKKLETLILPAPLLWLRAPLGQWGHTQGAHGLLALVGTACIQCTSAETSQRNCNDPAAGSPTATLLRLLLPLAAGHCPISAGNAHCPHERGRWSDLLMTLSSHHR